MRLFARRRLTAAEVGMARSVFGEEIRWDKVRVAQLPRLPFVAMVPFGRVIYFSQARAPLDFGVSVAEDQGLFIHELAHVWQAQRGVILAFAKLFALGVGAYAVKLKSNKKFRSYNIESQAEIVRWLFLARKGVARVGMLPELEKLWDTRKRAR